MDEYASHADLYDPLVGPFLKPVHSRMLAALNSRHCRKVVDLCCGTGLLAGMMTEVGLTPVGVDLSPAMLGVARRKHPAASFIEGDAASLAFQDGEFDAAAISFALHEKPSDAARAILAEAVRVTRPGGMLLVADYRIPHPGQSRLTGWGISLVERLAGREHYAHFRNYMRNGGSEAFLVRSGLAGLPAETFMHGWVGLYVHVC